MFVHLGSDHTETACKVRCALADLDLFRNHVEVGPGAVLGRKHALGTKDDTVLIRSAQCIQDLLDLLFAVFLHGLTAPAREDLVGVVVVMVPVVVVVMMMVMIMMMLMLVVIMVMIVMVFMLIVVMMVLVLFMIMVMMMLVLFMIMVVMMLMLIVIMVVRMLVIIVVMVVMVLVIIVVMVVMMFVIIVVMMMLVIIVAMMMLMVLMIMIVMMLTRRMYMAALRANLLFLQHLLLEGHRFLHHFKDLLTVKLRDRGRNDSRIFIDLTQHVHDLGCLFLIHNIGTAENNSACILHLVVKELTKVAHIHLALLRINDCCLAVQLHVDVLLYALHCLNDIRELADT